MINRKRSNFKDTLSIIWYVFLIIIFLIPIIFLARAASPYIYANRPVIELVAYGFAADILLIVWVALSVSIYVGWCEVVDYIKGRCRRNKEQN